jgi:hypothetical protein
VSLTVCVTANTIGYPKGGGHLWVYLNWALTLRALGHRVIWLEAIPPDKRPEKVHSWIVALQERLARHGLDGTLALCSRHPGRLPRALTAGCLDEDVASQADLVLNVGHVDREDLISRFRRSAYIDIDPGLNQVWISTGQMKLAPHDIYFTIGETVGRRSARFPDCGVSWYHTPPPVFLDAWPPTTAPNGASYTTVTHWWGSLMVYGGESYYNGKRDGFLPFVDLPRRAGRPLELAVCLGERDQEERALLERNGWIIRHAHDVAGTPSDYQSYLRSSRGEFSCAKPSCVHLENAWVSDRTLCYLASGKPAIVEHTGPSAFLPDARGLFRFRTPDEAVAALDRVEAEYDEECRNARALAEEFFDGRKVVKSVLDRALG